MDNDQQDTLLTAPLPSPHPALDPYQSVYQTVPIPSHQNIDAYRSGYETVPESPVPDISLAATQPMPDPPVQPDLASEQTHLISPKPQQRQWHNRGLLIRIALLSLLIVVIGAIALAVNNHPTLPVQQAQPTRDISDSTPIMTLTQSALDSTATPQPTQQLPHATLKLTPTPRPKLTPTSIPTATPAPKPTSTPTPVPTATPTPIPTNTPPPVPTAISTPISIGTPAPTP